MDHQKTIGQRIRTAREEAGLSQQQLGGKVGYSAMGISHLENGDRKIKLEDLQSISKELGVTISYLLEPVSPQQSYPSTFYRRGDEDINDEQKRAEQNALKKLDDVIKGLR